MSAKFEMERPGGWVVRSPKEVFEAIRILYPEALKIGRPQDRFPHSFNLYTEPSIYVGKSISKYAVIGWGDASVYPLIGQSFDPLTGFGFDPSTGFVPWTIFTIPIEGVRVRYKDEYNGAFTFIARPGCWQYLADPFTNQTYEWLFDQCEQLDGTPCGVEANRRH